MNDAELRQFISRAIEEDLGDGDHTSMACIPEDKIGKAELLVKQPGIIAGVAIAEKVFQTISPEVTFHTNIPDGTPVQSGDIVFSIEGHIHDILAGERLSLNIMQRMSGIATRTHQFVNMIKGLHTQIIDTRKTTPGMRFLEKMAVRIGGGSNHRMGLYDMILIKDNHIDFAGGIQAAIEKTKAYLQTIHKELNIEIEARNLDEVEQILQVGGIDRIMLDNFTFEDTRKAVLLIEGKYETESSGMVNLDNVREYAECGVDFISIGAITHQIRSLDLSLKAVV